MTNGDRHAQAEESILTAGLVPSAIGYDSGDGMDPYNNAVVYYFAFLTAIGLLVFAPVAVGVAIYRITKSRTHALRGLVVALLATGLGGALLALALTRTG